MKAAVITFGLSRLELRPRPRRLRLRKFPRRGTSVRRWPSFQRVWHKDTLPSLSNAAKDTALGTDVVGVPGGFSYGDYLRCGAIAAQSPISAAVRDHAARAASSWASATAFRS
jgi:hypothetical protein